MQRFINLILFSIVFSAHAFDAHFCEKVEKSFNKYGWESSQCQNYNFNSIRKSIQGDPLAWVTFGDVSDEDKESFKQKVITMIMCGVHGDEITPIKFCFDIMKELALVYADKKLLENEYKNKIVIVAPIVNPDSYFKIRPTRINARGVDVNRNFPTADWIRDAQKYWISKLKKDKRRNPGNQAGSEPEVVFQMNLIKRYHPDKIISVHSPLSMLDYDGPDGMVATSGVDGKKAFDLMIQMSKDASDYKIEKYPFFPGSLGNWAGRERDIPTYTLELPTTNPKKSEEYWQLFKGAIKKAIVEDLKHPTEKSTAKE